MSILDRIRYWLRRPRPRVTPAEAADEIREAIGPRMAPGPTGHNTDLYTEVLDGANLDD